MILEKNSHSENFIYSSEVCDRIRVQRAYANPNIEKDMLISTLKKSAEGQYDGIVCRAVNL